MVISKEERETIIRCGALDKAWDVWTDDKKYIGKFKKCGYVGKEYGSGYRFEVPLNVISIRKARKDKGKPRKKVK